MDLFQINDESRALIIKRDTAPDLEHDVEKYEHSLSVPEKIKWSNDDLFFPALLYT